jgi:hypothetical protein
LIAEAALPAKLPLPGVAMSRAVDAIQVALLCVKARRHRQSAR